MTDNAWPQVGPVAHDNTCRLIPGQYAETTEHALSDLADDEDDLIALIRLSAVTSSRHQAQEEQHPQGADRSHLVFGTPYSKIVNGAFTYSGQGARFHPPGPLGAWYCAIDLETAVTEVAYHRIIHLYETGISNEEDISFRLFLSDIHAQDFALLTDDHPSTQACLDPDSYEAGQSLGERMRSEQRGGVKYPSVRRAGGICLAVLQAPIVSNVRQGDLYLLSISGYELVDWRPSPRPSL